jgi:hypothetical protein
MRFGDAACHVDMHYRSVERQRLGTGSGFNSLHVGVSR